MERKWLVICVVIWHIGIVWTLVTEYLDQVLDFAEYPYIFILPLYLVLVIIGVYSQIRIWAYIGLFLSLAVVTVVLVIAGSGAAHAIWQYQVLGGELMAGAWQILFLARKIISKPGPSSGTTEEFDRSRKRLPAIWRLLGLGFGALLVFGITVYLLRPKETSALMVVLFTYPMVVLYVFSLHIQRPLGFKLASIFYGIFAITASIYMMVLPPYRATYSTWSYLFICLNVMYISCYVNLLSYDLKLSEEARSRSLKSQPQAGDPATQA